jgi:thiol-disulfide isomerase/thioredoxin
MEFVRIIRSICQEFADVSQSTRFQRQLLGSIFSALVLSALPGNAFCSSLKTIQAGPGDPRPEENDASGLIETRYKIETDKYDKAFGDFQNNVALDQPFHYDLSGLEEFLRLQMTSAANADARQTAGVFLVALTGYEAAIPSSLYNQVWHVVPPDSASWGKEAEAIEYESKGLDPEDAKEFLQGIVSHNSNRLIQARAQTALVRLASRQHDPRAYQLAYTKLEEYKDQKDARVEILFLNPQNKIVPGKAAPVFHLPAIDGSGEITNQNLSGKWYLLDFWATWCGPCLGERAALQKAYGKFKNRSFTIVSISLDETPDKVVSFRANRWSMPWQHHSYPTALLVRPRKTMKSTGLVCPGSFS